MKLDYMLNPKLMLKTILNGLQIYFIAIYVNRAEAAKHII